MKRRIVVCRFVDCDSVDSNKTGLEAVSRAVFNSAPSICKWWYVPLFPFSRPSHFAFFLQYIPSLQPSSTRLEITSSVDTLRTLKPSSCARTAPGTLIPIQRLTELARETAGTPPAPGAIALLLHGDTVSTSVSTKELLLLRHLLVLLAAPHLVHNKGDTDEQQSPADTTYDATDQLLAAFGKGVVLAAVA